MSFEFVFEGLHNGSNGRHSITVALFRLQKPARGARLCAQGSAVTMNSDTVSVLEGNTFVVGGRNGDVDAGPDPASRMDSFTGTRATFRGLFEEESP
jgi:hypothetical protein